MNALQLPRWVRQIWAVAFQPLYSWSWRVWLGIALGPLLLVGAGMGVAHGVKPSGEPWDMAVKPLLSAVTLSLLFGAVLLAFATWRWIHMQFHSPRYSLVPHVRRYLPWVAGVYVLLVAGGFATVFQTGNSSGKVFEAWVCLWLLYVVPVSVGIARLRMPKVTVVGQVLFLLVITRQLHIEFLPGLPARQAMGITVGLVGLGLAIVAAVMRWTFALRGDTHLAQCAATFKMEALFGAGGGSQVLQHSRIDWLFARFLAAKTRGVASARRARQLLPLVSGNSYHWTTFVSVAVLCALGGMLLLTGVYLVLPLGVQRGAIDALAIVSIIGFAAVLPAQHANATQYWAFATCKEQGLIGLTEFAPPRQAQTAVYLRHWVSQYFLQCTLALVLALAVWTLHFGHTSRVTPWQVAAIVACQLPVGAWMVRNYALEDGTHFLKGLRYLAVSLTLMGCSAVLHFQYAVPAALVCAVLLAFTLLALAYRWKRFAGNPAMFPAGRGV